MSTYKEVQQQLKSLREDGYDVTVKLNSKMDVLVNELKRIMALVASAECDGVDVGTVATATLEVETVCDLPVDYYCKGQSCKLSDAYYAQLLGKPVKQATTTMQVQARKVFAEQVKQVAHPKPVKHEAVACKPRKALSFEAYVEQERVRKQALQAKREAEFKAYQAKCKKQREDAARKQAEYALERRLLAEQLKAKREALFLAEQRDRQARNAARKARLAGNVQAQQASYYAGYRDAA